MWNSGLRTFEVKRQDVGTGASAHDRLTAIGMAIREAQAEAKDRADLRIAVFSTLHDKVQTEWESRR
jgi:hypothetical protein